MIIATVRRKHRQWSGEQQQRQIVSEVSVDGTSVPVVTRCYNVGRATILRPHGRVGAVRYVFGIMGSFKQTNWPRMTATGLVDLYQS